MEPKYRFLQTVIRERNGRREARQYRYDLVAHCPPDDLHYVMRARKRTRTPARATPGHEEATIASGLTGDEARIREVFLDIAHADQPVDPIHVPEIIADKAESEGLNGEKLAESRCLEDYYYYDRQVGIDEGRETWHQNNVR